MIPPPPTRSHRFNPPPGWPPPPVSWVPPQAPWDPDPSLPAAPDNWQWWTGPGPYGPGQQRNSASTWWRTQTRVARKLIIAGIVIILMSVILPRSSWFLTGKSLSGNGRAAADPRLVRASGLIRAVWARRPGSGLPAVPGPGAGGRGCGSSCPGRSGRRHSPGRGRCSARQGRRAGAR